MIEQAPCNPTIASSGSGQASSSQNEEKHFSPMNPLLYYIPSEQKFVKL